MVILYDSSSRVIQTSIDISSYCSVITIHTYVYILLVTCRVASSLFQTVISVVQILFLTAEAWEV